MDGVTTGSSLTPILVNKALAKILPYRIYTFLLPALCL